MTLSKMYDKPEDFDFDHTRLIFHFVMATSLVLHLFVYLLVFLGLFVLLEHPVK